VYAACYLLFTSPPPSPPVLQELKIPSSPGVH
jgi:hypothetical protein